MLFCANTAVFFSFLSMIARYGYTYVMQSAWCLGNIAGDCAEMRDLVLAAGAMEALVVSLSLPQNGSESFTR